MSNTITIRRRWRAACTGASILALAIAAPALAQEPVAEGADQIIVTGSRLKQDSTLDANGPVVAIGADDIKTSGQIDIGALLRESPALQASLPGSFSAFNGTALGASQLNLRNLGSERTLVLEDGRRHVSGIEGTGTVDVNTISTALLERVDITTGGASAVYGADAVTGVVNFIMRDGASFDGLEVRAQGGITDKGDAEEFFISVANGFEVDDGRGSIVFGAEYQKQTSIVAADRDFAGSGLFTRQANSPAVGAAFGIDPRFDNVFVPNATLPISSGGGVIALGDGNTAGFSSAFVEVANSNGVPGCATIGAALIPTCQFFDNGVLRPYNPGDVFIDPFAAVGGDAVPINPDDEILLPEVDRFIIQTGIEYEVIPSVNFFANVKYVTTRTTESNQVNGFNDDIPISLDNPFIPQALQDQIAILQGEGIDPIIAVSRDVLDLAARSNPVAERRTLRVVGGFNGEIPGVGFDYELSFNYGRTDADITSRSRLEDRFFAAIDAVVDPSTGEIVCRSDIDPSATVPPSSPFPEVNSTFGITTFQPGDGQCVPLNIFGLNSITPEAAEFVFVPTTSQNEIEQRDFLATISGDSSRFFELPAGPIGFALGYEYREEISRFTPDGFDLAGLTFGTLDSRGGPQNPSDGEYSVNEFFFEGNVPLLADLPFVKRLEVNGAVRFSDYDPYQSTTTWTAGARYAPVDSLAFRGTYSRAVRVPNIGEAFSPQFTVTLGASQDPCNPQFIDGGSEFRRANCIALVGPSAGAPVDPYNSTNFVSAFIPGVSGGNPDLSPETADTLTIGGVFRPTEELGGLLNGLIVTVDYYNIEIDGLIDTLAAFDIAQNCVDAPTLDNQFCDAIDRDPTFGFITGFRSGLINLAAVETSGIDWRIDYSFDMPAALGGLGAWRLSSLGTRFLKNDETRDVSAPDEITDVLRTLSRPTWIINFNADWDIGDWSLGWRGRYESSQLTPGLEPQDLINNPDFVNITETGGSIVNDFSVTYSLAEKVEFYGGVNNAFDREPYIGNLSRPAGPRGRFFYLGANVTF